MTLSATEFKLLACLMASAGRVVTRDRILDEVWQYDFGGESAIIESFISSLRKKVDADAGAADHTVRAASATPSGSRDDPAPPRGHTAITALLVVTALAFAGARALQRSF